MHIAIFRRVLALWLFAAPTLGAQKSTSKVPLAGTWTGTLTLDSGNADVEMQFRLTDSTIVGVVTAQGDRMGDMRDIQLLGDSIAFRVDRYEFNGRISGATIKFSMLMWNGVTRRPLTMTRRPDTPHQTGYDHAAPRRAVGEPRATTASRRR